MSPQLYKTVFLSLAITASYAAMVCLIGQEPDPGSSQQLRWVIPVIDPCSCTDLQLGGRNTITPYRPFNVNYFDDINLGDIKQWLNCSTQLPNVILHRSLGAKRDINIPCRNQSVNPNRFEVRGNPDLVKMVPGPDVAHHACAVYAEVGSYLDLGDFKDTCISDPGLCKSMTWSLWLKINTSSGFTGNRYYISSGGQSSQAVGFALLYKSDLEKFALISRSVRNTIDKRYKKNRIPLDSWFHLAVTIEIKQKVVKDVKLYIDGEFMLQDETRTPIAGIEGRYTKLYLGMPNTVDENHMLTTYSGSAAYSNLMMFDRLLNQDQIKNLMK
ncbi:uncharacterized protein [Asterias amurensis]|uniref:uncharacterized protein n=1 Tax=Asterias amurensis TaxID=7602 RepID=UPI003AB36488